MSTAQAVFLVVGILTVMGGPMLWWVFYRMDNRPSTPVTLKRPETLSAVDIAEIERVLEIALPQEYESFLRLRIPEIDATTVIDTAATIIEMTLDYRKGFSGLPGWAADMIYVGDEADACPYALNCATGELFRTDKGDLARPTLESYRTFSAFIRNAARNG